MKMKGITRNKLSPSSSSSYSNIFARVFPVSWFSKRKQKVEKPETVSKKKVDQLDSLSPNSGARCQSMDGGNSFRDERGNFPARRSTGGMTISSIFYEPDHEFAYFDDMVLDMKRVKGRTKESEQERVGAFDLMARNKMCSPITESKIRALEEMKRAAKDEVEGKSVFNSFAVVRNSFDPHRDFRDSMVEMITEERIGRAEEDLELLLACYLDLNSHVYHGIIIKVFKHVWFELRGHN